MSASPLELQPTEPQRRRLRLLLGAVFLHGLVYLLLMPAWMGEDEPWHFENMTHVAAGHWRNSDRTYGMDDQVWIASSQMQALRRFEGLEHGEAAQVQRKILGSMQRNHFRKRVDWAGREHPIESLDGIAIAFTAAHQPPLYYFVCAPIIALTSGASIETQLIAVRTFSLALFLLVVYLSYLAARVVFPGADDRPALLAAFLCGWFPMHARMAAVVNNDILGRVFVTFAILISLRMVARLASRKELAALAVLCLLGVATKSTALSAIGVAVLAFALVPRGRVVRGSKWMLIVGAIAVVAGAYFFWRNMHNPAVPHSIRQVTERLQRGLSLSTLLETRDSLLGSFNWESRAQPGWLQTSFGLFILGTVAAGVFAIVKEAGTRRRLLLLCLGTCAIQFAMIVLRGVGKGRYLIPALSAFTIVAVAGLVQALPERHRNRVAIALVVGLVLYDTGFLWAGLVQNQYLIWGS